MQAKANQQSAQAASQGRMQEQQIKTKGEAELLQLKAQLDMQKMEAEAQKEAEMMKLKFEYDMQLRNVDSKNLKKRETSKEDRKDKRTQMQATQQSEMISQRKQNLPPKDFAKKKTKVEQLTSKGNMFGPAGLNLIGAQELFLID